MVVLGPSLHPYTTLRSLPTPRVTWAVVPTEVNHFLSLLSDETPLCADFPHLPPHHCDILKQSYLTHRLTSRAKPTQPSQLPPIVKTNLKFLKLSSFCHRNFGQWKMPAM